ncbi:alpha/beta fold hydrolase [Deinococcus fonticola]|uniref:alpha/beta fold hydrolase n=1 Tax=Deinococcus fonticola TaxID=2528713 RepID=UPI001074ECEA|nr:alpha/beta fold hydrolase [Deinococcus fonticola]
MTTPEVPEITSSDAWVNHPHGQLLTRTWTPAGALSGVPILLFHDSLGSVELWRHFPAQLSKATRRQVIAYDRLGFGQSDAYVQELPLDFIADEARTYVPALMEQLGLKRFIALGHSVGGGIAVNVAALYPQAVVALISESAQAFVEDQTLSGVAEAREQFRDERQVARLAKYHGNKARWVLSAWTDTWLSPDFGAWTLKDVLPRVTCPLLVIHGVHDEYGSLRHPQMIGELSGGPAQVEIIQEAYHVPHREKPEVIVQMVAAFVANLE